jgi:hypothetical protein
MNTTSTSERSGSLERLSFPDQSNFSTEEHGRRRKSILADMQVEVEKLGYCNSPSAPMHVLTGTQFRRATEPVDSSSSATNGLTRFIVPSHWGEQASSNQPVSHVGKDNLLPAQRVLSPEPRPSKPMFKGTDFRLGSTLARKTVSISPPAQQRTNGLETSFARKKQLTAPVGYGGHLGQAQEASRSNSSLGSISSSKQYLDDSSSIRSKSSLGFARPSRHGDWETTMAKKEQRRRSQLEKLDMSNLQELARSSTPEHMQHMAIWSTIDHRKHSDTLGSRKSPPRSSSQLSRVFLSVRYSPAQLGVDGYGAPASLPEDIDEILNRDKRQGNTEAQRLLKETMRSSSSTPTLKRSLRHLQLKDGFVNPASFKRLKETMMQSVDAFGRSRAPVVSKESLLYEKAQDLMHDTPAYKQPLCGFNMRGEMMVYSWAAPHDFRGQHANPRIHPPEKPPPPATSAKAKFHGFEDDEEKMRNLRAAVKADSLFQDPKGVRTCGHNGVGFFTIPAGGGRPTRAVKQKQEGSGYHKYLSPDLLQHECTKFDVPAEPELRFLNTAPMINDERAQIAKEEEPRRGEWKGAADIYPGYLVPSATRYRFVERLKQEDLPKGTKNFFVKESVNRSLPGAQKPLASEFPFREIVAGNGPYKTPSGII